MEKNLQNVKKLLSPDVKLLLLGASNEYLTGKNSGITASSGTTKGNVNKSKKQIKLTFGSQLNSPLNKSHNTKPNKWLTICDNNQREIQPAIIIIATNITNKSSSSGGKDHQASKEQLLNPW